MDSPVIQPCQVRLRHIRLGEDTEPGSVQLLDAHLVPQPPEGVNGPPGWTAGDVNPSLSDTGEWSVTLPNAAGQDGVMHRERFLILTDPQYRPGDEWIEIYRSQGPLAAAGELLMVGTPTRANITRGEIQLAGTCGLGLLAMQRETDAGTWTGHAPRDVFHHYTGVWTPRLADAFTQTGRFPDGDDAYDTTADGEWQYHRAYQNIAAAPGAASLYVQNPFTGGLFSTRQITSSVWRVEIKAWINTDAMLGAFTPARQPAAVLRHDGTNATCATYDNIGNVLASKTVTLKRGELVAHVIEQRDRWTWFFAGGDLLAVLPNSTRSGAKILGAAAGDASLTPDRLFMSVHEAIAREHTAFLNRTADKGDPRLPGDLPQGGLVGSYIDDAGRQFAELLNPAIDETAGLTARREDLQLNFPSADPPAWQPAGVPATNFSARWTGAVYLDLDQHDYALRAQADDRVRVWVARTLFGEQLIDDWTSAGHAMSTTTGAWLKAGNAGTSAPSGNAGILAGQPSGWYPIVIEYSQTAGGAGLIVEANRDDHRTTWAALGASSEVKLSPLGCHAGDPKHDSHLALLEQLRDTFGLQYQVQPRSLESGEFPATVRPRVRAGADTDIVIDTAGATGLGKQITAEDTCDQLLVDTNASGTREAVDYSSLNTPGGHLLHPRGQESLSDITIQQVAEQRALALLALLASPWEDVSAAPDGYRRHADTFPLTGAAAVFAWQPGDGVRLRFPELATIDATPRQLTSVQWPIRPDGLGRPGVRFRQRPRDLRAVLRALARAIAAQQRLS